MHMYFYFTTNIWTPYFGNFSCEIKVQINYYISFEFLSEFRADDAMCKIYEIVLQLFRKLKNVISCTVHTYGTGYYVFRITSYDTHQFVYNINTIICTVDFRLDSRF